MQQSSESKSIRAEVRKLPRGTRRRFSTSLRARIGRFAQRRLAEGASLVEVASEIEVSKQTIARARRQEIPPPALVPVEVVRSVQGRSEIRICAPGGLVIEGLDVENVAALIRALG